MCESVGVRKRRDRLDGERLILVNDGQASDKEKDVDPFLALFFSS